MARANRFKLAIYDSSNISKDIPLRLVEFFALRFKIFGSPSFENGPDKYDLYPNTLTFVFHDDNKVVGGLRIVQGKDGATPFADKFGRVNEMIPGMTGEYSFCEIGAVCAIDDPLRIRHFLGTDMQKTALEYIRKIIKTDFVVEGLRAQNVGPAYHATKERGFKTAVITGKEKIIHDIPRVPAVFTWRKDIDLAQITDSRDKPQKLGDYYRAMQKRSPLAK